jgi:hypothetical protein
MAALRIWNDPTARFRTGGFALLFVAAWNSLAIAALQRQRDGGEVDVPPSGVEAGVHH